MFNHRGIDTIPFEEIPTHQDVYLMDEVYMEEYEKFLLAVLAREDVEPVGLISYVGVRNITQDALELSWYPNISDRFHEVTIVLPRDQFVTCVECANYGERPRIFVKTEWLSLLHSRPYSAFALVDAIGVKNAIRSGRLENQKLAELRTSIDVLAKNHPEIAFVSFADSILLKIQWRPGFFQRGIKYSYEPEALIRLFPDLSSIYNDTLGLKIYAVIAQGSNEYFDEALLHISKEQNHICLNSLGLPFAQVMEIDTAVRKALHENKHPPTELYLDQKFFHSIQFQYEFDKGTQPSAEYLSSLSGEPQSYYYTSCETLLSNLQATG